MSSMDFPFGKKQTDQASTGMKTGPGKVDRFWADSPSLQELRLISWMEHPRVQRYINSRTTGDPTLTWFPYVNQKYIPFPLSRALSLGCGKGGLERHAFSLGTVENFDAIDISSGSIDEARSTAQHLGLDSKVNYIVADLNELHLSPLEYDAVFASMSIHHVEDLEALCTQICLSLRDGGYFICNEYIGPSRFQLPADRLKLVNELLPILPTRYRRIIRDGKASSDVKTGYNNLPLTWFDEHDPSEAIRSADIMSIIRQHFHIVEYRPYGGGLLFFMLENIVGNFQDGQEEDNAWLDILTYIEQFLEERAVIDSDYALIVATPIKP
jgi:SAM-dependent methyltransferase